MNTDLSVPLDRKDIATAHECHSKDKSTRQILINMIEKISAVGLGVFSFYTNGRLFVSYFLVGCCIGIYSYATDENACQENHSHSTCAHGLLEGLTGVKLPVIISLIATIAEAICHIDHHPSVSVPIVGVSLGNWVGKTASHYGVFAQKKVAHLCRRPICSL